MSSTHHHLHSLGKHPVLGAGISLSAAVFLGICPSLFQYAFRDGASTLFILFLHGLAPTLILLCYALIVKKPLNLRKTPLRAGILSTIAISLSAISIMYALTLIPASLVIILIYIFPILVFITTAILTRKMPSIRLMLIYLLTFFGLVLAVGPSFDNINLWGVLLSLLGAFGCAMMYFVGHASKGMVETHSPLLIGCINLTLIAFVAMILTDDYQMSGSLFGFSLLILGVIFYGLGTICIFLSVDFLRPDLSSLIMNIEPFVTIITAYFLLHDSLSFVQLLGVCVVIGSLTLGGIIAHKEGIE